VEKQTALFFARFLADIPASWDNNVTYSLRYSMRIVCRQYGRSYFVNACPPLDDVVRAEIGLEEAEAALQSGRHEVVLLSQILTAVEERLLSLQDVIRLIANRPPHVRLILTGRKAPEGLLEHSEHIPNRISSSVANTNQ
jgi:cob(I)alamin adenosyltransferase